MINVIAAFSNYLLIPLGSIVINIYVNKRRLSNHGCDKYCNRQQVGISTYF